MESSPAKKRVMVLVEGERVRLAEHAVAWAAAHLINPGDVLTLLHIIAGGGGGGAAAYDGGGVGAEVVVVGAGEGESRAEIVGSYVRKLDVTVLVIGLPNSSPFFSWCECWRKRRRSSEEKLLEECIRKAECLTIGVKRQKEGVGGYLITTRWQKDFWLLA